MRCAYWGRSARRSEAEREDIRHAPARQPFATESSEAEATSPRRRGNSLAGKCSVSYILVVATWAAQAQIQRGDILALYAQANLLQIMQSTACNALHAVKQRCCRIRVLKRKKVEQTVCECYEVIRAHFRRLGL